MQKFRWRGNFFLSPSSSLSPTAMSTSTIPPDLLSRLSPPRASQLVHREGSFTSLLSSLDIPSLRLPPTTYRVHSMLWYCLLARSIGSRRLFGVFQRKLFNWIYQPTFTVTRYQHGSLSSRKYHQEEESYTTKETKGTASISLKPFAWERGREGKNVADEMKWGLFGVGWSRTTGQEIDD